MKVKNLFFFALFIGSSFASFQYWKPVDFNFHSGRNPASEKAQPAEEVKPVVTCHSESKGEKLETDVKNLIQDKEKVIEKVDEKKIDEKKDEKIVNKPVDQAELMALLSKLTTLMTAQMQVQMQMMSMLSTQLSQGFQAPSADMYSHANSSFSLDQNFNPEAYGIGLGAQHAWHESPYFSTPKLERQPAQSTSDFIYRTNQHPMMNGYDFGVSPLQYRMPEMSRNFMF